MLQSDFSEVIAVLEANGLDAAAFVPGPNFMRLLGRDFHLMERPLVLVIPRSGPAMAIVPNLEMASFGTIGFDGPDDLF